MYQKDADCFPRAASFLCVITSTVPPPAACTGLRHIVKNHKARTTRLHVLILVSTYSFSFVFLRVFYFLIRKSLVGMVDLIRLRNEAQTNRAIRGNLDQELQEVRRVSRFHVHNIPRQWGGSHNVVKQHPACLCRMRLSLDLFGCSGLRMHWLPRLTGATRMCLQLRRIRSFTQQGKKRSRRKEGTSRKRENQCLSDLASRRNCNMAQIGHLTGPSGNASRHLMTRC